MISGCNRVVLLGDFNCKNVNWKEMEVYGNTEPWGEELIQLAMENTMDQWVKEYIRYRGTEEPSMVDLLFTKKLEQQPAIKYLSPTMGKSDHIVMEVEL